MKRTLRFVTLAGIVALTSWLATNAKVQAAGACENWANTGCRPNGYHTTCVWASGAPGSCTCIRFGFVCT